MKASSVRRKPQKLGVLAPLSIPDEIWKHHQTEILNVDCFFVQALSYFPSIGTTYEFRTVDTVVNRDKPTNENIVRSVKKTINIYRGRGVTVSQINGDNQFTGIKDEIYPIAINIVAAGEHVGPVERSI